METSNEQRTNRPKELRDAPREGISIAHFLTVADIERSARYYEKVFGARILSLGDGNAPGYLQLANIWMILNVGGGPTPDKPTVTLSVPVAAGVVSKDLMGNLSTTIVIRQSGGAP
jgi:hypothetical protein